MSNANPTVLEKLVFKPFGPYRFIGKGVCAAPGSSEVFGALWKDWNKISEPLNNMKEYKVTEEPNSIALLDNKGIDEFQNKMWYTIGFFMKPDTPVPNGYDFRDIPAIYVAEGHFKGEFWTMVFSQHSLLQDAICAQSEYVFASPVFAAEVYIPETDADKDGISRMKYYISCELNPDK
ncbi:MAG: GyrI-like domain-containing protein [Oscillospiraceae bacterium]|nr:GyrI-like domain-containing protein [Oscillospiraceae bacterium]